MNKKRKYEKIVARRIADDEHKKFLVERLQNEWEELEKQEKAHERRKILLDLAKTGGSVVIKTLLVAALLGGAVVVAAVAPNVVSIFGRGGSNRRFFNAKELKHSISYLKLKGYADVKKEKWGNEYEITLTKSGVEKTLQNAFTTMHLRKQKNWDGLWRVVLFDIPHKRKSTRDGFRRKLNVLGFYQLQKSVFVFPYPCKTEVDFCSDVFNVADYVRFIETSNLEPEGDLKDFFEIS